MKKEKERLIIYRNILAVIYLLLIVLFCYFCMQSGEDSTETSGFLTNAICNLFSITKTEEIASFVRKLVGHFGFFLVFGLVSSLLFMTFYKWSYIKQTLVHFGLGITYILITEFLFQVVAINRGPSFKDCLIDFSGFLLVTLAVACIYYLVILNNKKKLYENNKFMLIYRITTGIILLSLVVTYIILSLQNNVTSNTVSNTIGQTVVDVTPGISGDVSTKSQNVKLFIRKILGHFGYFVLLGLSSYLFSIGFKNKYKNIILIISQISFGILFAIISEFILETIATNRSPNVKDFFTDTLGYILISINLYFCVYFSMFVFKIKKSRHKRIDE